MKLARLVNGRIAEFARVPEGAPKKTTIEDCFHPDFLASLVSVPDEAVEGAMLVDGLWLVPEPEYGPRLVSGKMLRYRLNASGKRAAVEKAVLEDGPDTVDWWASKVAGMIPETSPKLVRVLESAGLSVTKIIDETLED